MTEQEWLEVHPDLMELWERMQGRATDRKLRLFGCACCRRIWHLLTDERSRHAVAMAEQFADGSITDDELYDAATAAQAAIGPFNERATWYSGERRPLDAADPAADAAWWSAHQGDAAWSIAQEATEAMAAGAVRGVFQEDNAAYFAARTAEWAYQYQYFRCVFGPLPFQPVALPVSPWQSTTVVSLAQVIYDEKVFDQMPILADALEDAGCDNAEILNHCRQPGEHVRGCWVVDLLLNKK